MIIANTVTGMISFFFQTRRVVNEFENMSYQTVLKSLKTYWKFVCLCYFFLMVIY